MVLREQIQSEQERLGAFFQSFPNKKIVLTKEKRDELRQTLDHLKELHENSRTPHSWQECLGHYELLKSRGEKPDETDIGESMGLGDRRLKGRIWPRVIRDHGYEIDIAPHVPESIAKRNGRLQKVERTYAKMRRKGEDVTARSLAKQVSVAKQTAVRYANELGLTIDSEKKIKSKENAQKVISSYRNFNGHMPPTKGEISKDTGFSKEYVAEVCGSSGLTLLNGKDKNKKIVYDMIKKLKMSGKFLNKTNNVQLHRFIASNGYDIHLHTVKRWRKVLENEGAFKESDIRKTQQPTDKYSKYMKDYLEIVEERSKMPGTLKIKDISEELSKRFGEPVPYQRIDRLRQKTGLPRVLTNEDRYKNIVEVYKNNPKIKLEDWANLAHVSFGFLYKAVAEMGELDIAKKYGAPESITTRLPVESNPLLNSFKALGNTNRVRMLKIIGSSSELTPNEVTALMGYRTDKWQNTIDYHLRVLERAGLIVRENGMVSASQKTESLMPALQDWNVKKIVPEEIFGPGYNKPLFASAASKKPKSLKSIVNEMRRQKGHMPYKVQSSESSERKPVGDDFERRIRFQRYLSSSLGVYSIKKEYADIISAVIESVENANTPENAPLAMSKREGSPAQYITDEIRKKNLNPMKIRNIVADLAAGREVYQPQLGMDAKDSVRHFIFVKENFGLLCKNMKIEPKDATVGDYSEEGAVYLKAGPAISKEGQIYSKITSISGLKRPGREVVENVAQILVGADYECSMPVKIDYGFQSKVSYMGRPVGNVRIYDSKNGTTIDLSAIFPAERDALLPLLGKRLKK